MKFIKNKYDIIFSLLIISLPFSKGIPNIIMGVLWIIFLIDFKKEYFNKYFNCWIIFIFKIITIQRQIEPTIQKDFRFFQ